MLKQALLNSLAQALDLISIIDNLDEKRKSETYIEAGIGRHIRHIADHLQALLPAIESGIMDYNLRRRGHRCETDISIGRSLLEELYKKYETLDYSERALEVISEVDVTMCQTSKFQSNLSREILYLINHTIHHTAYISLLAKTQEIEVPSSIGLAPATATFLRAS